MYNQKFINLKEIYKGEKRHITALKFRSSPDEVIYLRAN